MAATLRRLRTKADRLRAEQAAELRQLVLDYPALPEQARRQIVVAIDRQTAAENGWTFVMLSPSQNRAVQRWLVENSKRPQKATLLWAELFTALWERGPDALDRPFADDWAAAADEAGRRRVVVDQVASLTDASAVSRHATLVD